MELLALVQEEYSSQINLAYQSRESLYKNIVTIQSGVVGDTTWFNNATAGKPAGKKAPFGKVPRNGGSLGRVRCDLETFYAGDELPLEQVSSTSANGMLVITDNTMASMEQKFDELIRTALDSTTNEIAHGSDGLTLAKVDALWKKHVDAKVYKKKELPINFIGSTQWNELMAINEFKNSDIIGNQQMPFIFSQHEQGRIWRDMLWKVDADLPVASSIRKCFSFVPSAVGVATSGINKVYMEEQGDTDSILYYVRQKLGACLINSIGAVEIQCDES